MIHTHFIQKHRSHAYLPVLLNYLNSLLWKAFISSNRGIFFMRQWLLNYQSLSIMTKMMMIILAWLLSREAWTSCIVWYQQVIWYQQTSIDWGVKHCLRLNEIILSSPVLRFKQSLYPFWYFYAFKTCTAQLLQRLPTSENGNDLN